MSHVISIVDILSEGTSSFKVPRYSQVVVSPTLRKCLVRYGLDERAGAAIAAWIPDVFQHQGEKHCLPGQGPTDQRQSSFRQ